MQISYAACFPRRDARSRKADKFSAQCLVVMIYARAPQQRPPHRYISHSSSSRHFDVCWGRYFAWFARSLTLEYQLDAQPHRFFLSGRRRETRSSHPFSARGSFSEFKVAGAIRTEPRFRLGDHVLRLKNRAWRQRRAQQIITGNAFIEF